MTKKPAYENLQKEIAALRKENKRLKKTIEKLSVYEMILSTVREPMCLVDPDYTYREVNNAYLAFLNRDRAEVIGQKLPDLLGTDVFKAKVKLYLDRAFSGEVVRYEERFQYPGIGWRYALISFYPLIGEDGSVLGIISTAGDITERKEAEEALKQSHNDLDASVKERTAILTQAIRQLEHEIDERTRAEEELRRSEEKFSKIFQASPDLIAITTLDGGIYRDVNESFLRVSGFSKEEVIGRSSIDLNIWEKPEDRERIIGQIQEHGFVRNYEARYRIKDGSLRGMLCSCELIDFGGEKCILSASRDITERKRLEGELRRSQKMEAVGRLAGGITHDFNNLLTAIDGYCELALLKLDETEQVRKNLVKIKEVKNAATSLIRQLLAFSRKQKIRQQVLDINSIVENMENLLTRFIGEDIELKTDLESATGLVRADQGQIEQIIMNLALNARDAMPSGGIFTIATSQEVFDRESAQEHADLKPGGYVRLTISDTGVGMDEETLSHVFEPFFTTKEESKGTGLGLTTVYGIVKQSKGCISLKSEPGQGTTFEIYFPRIAKAREVTTGKKERIEPTGGTETILIVEDNAYVRDLTVTALKDYGYTILEAEGGIEALRLCSRHEGSIDLLITDIVLPRMSGLQLAENLEQTYPGLKTLYISGYPEEVVAHYGIPDAGRNLLEKPFSPSKLAHKVRDVLDRNT
ncbi:MAG TPA: PAS domain S-box protein [Deltaproteobacteria bacterium]|nr:PAS domain S-box protein [Deltaproteobacteria bacterium]